jgi:outer membrane protein TolC
LSIATTALQGQTTLSFDDFSARVLANHPVAEQARLVGAQARAAYQQEGRGAFDPKLLLSMDQKTYKGNLYYNYVDAGIKVPTPIGSDIKLGYERTSGSRTNPDRSTPSNGLLSLGLSIPLGQRLITDERRTALSVARAQRSMGEAEQQGILNKLLFSAAKVYGAWYVAQRAADIAADGVRLATFRLEAVQQRIRSGEAPPVDSLEASLEVQRRLVTQAEADVDLRASRLIAESYLWDERMAPAPLPGDARPAMVGLDATTADTLRLAAWLADMMAQHPDLRKAQAKLRVNEAEQLLARQAQLPFAEASLSAIGAREPRESLLDSERWGENFKATLDVESSILFFKERGKAQRAGQKVEFSRLDLDLLKRELAYAVRIALNDVVLYERLLQAQRANVRAASLLRDAEQTRFLNGESTLLTVNLRERLLLDESVKLASAEGKLLAARAALVVAVGNPTLVSR